MNDYYSSEEYYYGIEDTLKEYIDDKTNKIAITEERINEIKNNIKLDKKKKKDRVKSCTQRIDRIKKRIQIYKELISNLKMINNVRFNKISDGMEKELESVIPYLSSTDQSVLISKVKRDLEQLNKEELKLIERNYKKSNKITKQFFKSIYDKHVKINKSSDIGSIGFAIETFKFKKTKDATNVNVKYQQPLNAYEIVNNKIRFNDIVRNEINAFLDKINYLLVDESLKEKAISKRIENEKNILVELFAEKTLSEKTIIKIEKLISEINSFNKSKHRDCFKEVVEFLQKQIKIKEIIINRITKEMNSIVDLNQFNDFVNREKNKNHKFKTKSINNYKIENESIFDTQKEKILHL